MRNPMFCCDGFGCQGLAIGSLVQSSMLLKLASKLSISKWGLCCDLVQIVEILLSFVRMKHMHAHALFVVETLQNALAWESVHFFV